MQQNKFLRIIIFFLGLISFHVVNAQQVSRLTITDNLTNASKLNYSKPKPAPPKSNFTILPDKGTQVLFYADLVPSETLPDFYKLKFTAYKTDQGKDEWIDDRTIEVKKTAAYSMIAFNFFEEGNYKLLITGTDSTNVLAQGEFRIGKQ